MEQFKFYSKKQGKLSQYVVGGCPGCRMFIHIVEGAPTLALSNQGQLGEGRTAHLGN